MKKIRPAWKPESSLFDRFALELQRWTESGEKPSLADQDTCYYLELTEQRLKKKNLVLKLKLELFKEEIRVRQRFRAYGAAYDNFREALLLRKIAEYTRAGKRLYLKRNDQTMYQVVTEADTPEVIGEKPYTCPNCGATARVAELTVGCPYCGARFQMKELFPKVTNFYFIHSIQSKGSINRRLLLFYVLGSAVMFPVLLLPKLASGDFSFFGAIWTSLFGALGIGLLLVPFIGAPLSVIWMIISNSSKDVPIRALFATKKRIVSFMKPLVPGFSYEYFEAQIMSLLRMVILSDDVKNLAAFDGAERSACFDDIIDVVYEGGMTVRRLWATQDCCHMELRTYMLDTYEKDGRIFTRGDHIDISVERSLPLPPDKGFSIKLVSCRGCGGSFDASHRKNCPYCGRAYEMRAESWVLTRAVRVK